MSLQFAYIAGTEAEATLTEDADELAIEGGGEWWFNGARPPSLLLFRMAPVT